MPLKKKILEAFHFRHACKSFDPKRRISDDDFLFLLEVARLSPSSFGFEPWQLLVVQNPALRERLKTITWGGQKQLPTASHVVVMLAKRSIDMRYDSNYINDIMTKIKGLDEEAIQVRRGFYETFQRSDFQLLDDDRAMFDWACKQTYLVLANMMTAAALVGIDSCPIEGFVMDEMNQLLADVFDVDLDRYGVSCLVAFGYRANPAPPKTRQPLQDIVTWYR